MTTLTVQDYESAVFHDRFQKIFDILDFLRVFDLAKLGELVDAAREVTTAIDLVDQVKTGLGVLRVMATMTETDVDDHMIEIIDSVLTDDMLDIIVRIVCSMTDGGDQGRVIAMQDTAVIYVQLDSGIPWTCLIQISLQIIQLLANLGILSDG